MITIDQLSKRFSGNNPLALDVVTASILPDRISLIFRGENIAEGTPDDLKLRVRSEATPDPTLEDAFIALIEQNQK